MKILLDTNIIIQRGDDKVLDKKISEVARLLGKIKAEVIIHPLMIKEVENDKNEARKKVILSKVGTYALLPSPPVPKDAFMGSLGENLNDHNRMDGYLLYAVAQNAVTFLLTEDRDLIKKARRMKLDDRVMPSDEMVLLLSKLLPSEKIQPSLVPSLMDRYAYEIDVGDHIFDSLRDEYGVDSFNNWFKKIQLKQRHCIVYEYPDKTIGAILIIKDENEELKEMTPPFPKERRVKINTFKADIHGQKIGELFLKIAHDYALSNGISELYLTHFTRLDTDLLVDLITSYGFVKLSTQQTNGKQEDVYFKKIFYDPSRHGGISKQDLPRSIYPSIIDGLDIRKFIVPIKPEYYSRLFVDVPKRQTVLDEHLGRFIVEGNTILKAYLCHATITKVRPGDIIIFYRSNDGVLTTIGTVDHVSDETSIDQVLTLVSKRTVYSVEELDALLVRRTKVILFIHNFHLKHPVHRSELERLGISPPQSIIEIDDAKYKRIKHLGRVDPRLTVQ